jgi:hypothetical protein
MNEAHATSIAYTCQALAAIRLTITFRSDNFIATAFPVAQVSARGFIAGQT